MSPRRAYLVDRRARITSSTRGVTRNLGPLNGPIVRAVSRRLPGAGGTGGCASGLGPEVALFDDKPTLPESQQ